MKAPLVKPVRCAIYTRVSTEHGLDQEFNSLDAQYEAASAYIKSQTHAGWTLIRSRYDDGGYSGGSTDRPDLQKLLDDVRARKIAIIEEEAEVVRLIFRRYLELGSVNELLRDLNERNIRTRTKQLSTGATRGGIPFGRGALYYVLSNHFYIGEVKYRNEILPGEQPPIMDRALFESVRQKSLGPWSHRTVLPNKS